MDNILANRSVHSYSKNVAGQSRAFFDWYFAIFEMVPAEFFPRASTFYFLPKIGRPINFLVVSGDRMAADFEHWTDY